MRLSLLVALFPMTLAASACSSEDCTDRQCGVCTPGFLVAAKALLDKNPSPSEHEIRFNLANNLCRCTGYDKIVRAVQAAAKELAAAK